MNQSTHRLAAALLVATCGTLLANDERSEIPASRLWKTFAVRDAGEVSAIVAGIDDTYLAIGNTYSQAEGEGHWWGELNQDGRKTRETKNWDPAGFTNSRVMAARQNPDGSVWIVGNRTVSKFSTDGKMLFSKSVYKISPLDRFGLEVRTAVAASDGGLILAGQTKKTSDTSDAWIMAINNEGQKLWEHSFDFGQDELIVSGIRSGKDQYVFAAVSGNYDKFGAGFNQVQLIQCTDQGTKTGEYSTKGTMLPGGMSTIASSDERIVLGVSRMQFPYRDAWLLCLDSELKPVWEKQIGGREVTAFTPAVGVSADGTFVTGWNATKSFRIWQIDQSGKVLTDQSFPNARGFYVPEKTGAGRLFLQDLKPR